MSWLYVLMLRHVVTLSKFTKFVDVYINYNYMKKEIFKIIIKVALYALGLIAAYFGVSTMTSCSTSHSVAASGRTTIVTVDSTIVKHSGYVRSKNFKPYD